MVDSSQPAAVIRLGTIFIRLVLTHVNSYFSEHEVLVWGTNSRLGRWMSVLWALGFPLSQ